MATNSFKFLGFAPKNKSRFEQFIESINNEYQTSIFFVSNHRLILCLEALNKKLATNVRVNSRVTEIPLGPLAENAYASKKHPSQYIEFLGNFFSTHFLSYTGALEANESIGISPAI